MAASIAAKIKDIGEAITIPAAGSNAIRIQQKELNGKRYVDVRTYYFDKKTNALMPTSKGLWIPKDKISEVLLAMEETAK